MSKVLVVDDKEMMRDSVATILGRRGHSVVAAPGGEAALERIGRKRPDAVVTDLQMPGMSGLELLAEIRRFDEDLPVVFMTAYGTIDTAVEAMRNGAFDYVTKPFSGDELLIAVERAIEHGKLRLENQVLKAAATLPTSAQSTDGVTMVGGSEIMTGLRSQLDRIAASQGTVLINGESGTGKEVAARYIHEASPRKDAPFLALNCAALSPSLLESELFGHEKGAYTGADQLRKGRFELANGGTLLLDEISEIPPELQSKLLRVLQEQAFERVGSSSTQSVDVRVIATTNRDLATEVDAGRFRGDLFFRLNVLPIEMPALRDRGNDVTDLARFFLEGIADREGGTPRRLEPGAEAVLSAYPWPGNVRELQNICERASVLAAGDVITAELLRPWLAPASTGFGEGAASAVNGVATNGATAVSGGVARRLARPITPAPEQNGAVGSDSTEASGSMICNGELKLADIEREAILATLARNNGHRQKSAQALGIGVRTLGLKLKKWKEERLVEASV